MSKVSFTFKKKATKRPAFNTFSLEEPSKTEEAVTAEPRLKKALTVPKFGECSPAVKAFFPKDEHQIAYRRALRMLSAIINEGEDENDTRPVLPAWFLLGQIVQLICEQNTNPKMNKQLDNMRLFIFHDLFPYLADIANEAIFEPAFMIKLCQNMIIHHEEFLTGKYGLMRLKADLEVQMGGKMTKLGLENTTFESTSTTAANVTTRLKSIYRSAAFEPEKTSYELILTKALIQLVGEAFNRKNKLTETLGAPPSHFYFGETHFRRLRNLFCHGASDGLEIDSKSGIPVFGNSDETLRTLKSVSSKRKFTPSDTAKRAPLSMQFAAYITPTTGAGGAWLSSIKDTGTNWGGGLPVLSATATSSDLIDTSDTTAGTGAGAGAGSSSDRPVSPARLTLLFGPSAVQSLDTPLPPCSLSDLDLMPPA